MNIIFVNQSTSTNQFVIFDENDGDAIIFNENIEPWGERNIQCLMNDSEYGNIKFSMNNHIPEFRSLIKDGDRIIA